MDMLCHPPPGGHVRAPRLRAHAGSPPGIQGMRWFNVEVSGESAHAGTAPVSLRRDALREAVAMIAALRELTTDPSDITRFTVGRMLVTPNSVAFSITQSIALHIEPCLSSTSAV